MTKRRGSRNFVTLKTSICQSQLERRRYLAIRCNPSPDQQNQFEQSGKDMERFFSIHRTLIFFGTGSACKIFATRGVQQQRFVLMHVPYDRFRRMQVENSHFVLEELTIMPVLGVLDEAHGLYRLFQSGRNSAYSRKFVPSKLISDLSQSFLSPDMLWVNFAEAVCSTQRVVFGANAFQLQYVTRRRGWHIWSSTEGFHF